MGGGYKVIFLDILLIKDAKLLLFFAPEPAFSRCSSTNSNFDSAVLPSWHEETHVTWNTVWMTRVSPKTDLNSNNEEVNA